jgi:hypothetical protein
VLDDRLRLLRAKAATPKAALTHEQQVERAIEVLRAHDGNFGLHLGGPGERSHMIGWHPLEGGAYELLFATGDEFYDRVQAIVQATLDEDEDA